jgi:hypothetical protein
MSGPQPEARALGPAPDRPRARAATRETALAVGLVTLFGAVVRLAMVETLPLVVTPDGLWYPEGRGYLVWAEEILTRGDLSGPPLRTPGYPVLLAAAFAVAGVRDYAVLGLQHLLGLGAVALLTLVAAQRAGPRVAVATGVLAAVDPWHLLFAHYALTEATAAFFAVATAAAALLRCSRPGARAFAVGLLAGATCLVRPSSQLFVPFFAAAALLAGPLALRRLAASGAAFALGLALALGPWLAFNASRGIHGLAMQRESLLFVPMVFHRLLDARDMPADTPAAVRAAFEVSDAERADPAFADRFLRAANTHGLSYEQRQGWSRRSLVRNASRYPAAAWDTLRTLLDMGRPRRPPIPDELLAFVVRLTSEPRGSILQSVGLSGALPTPDPLLPAALARPARAAFTHAYGITSWVRGVPQVPLALAACLAAALCLRRRRPAEATVLAGSLAFVAIHAAILYPHQRFVLPSELIWYASLPLLLEARRGR